MGITFISTQPRVTTLIDQISSIRIAISTKSKRYREKHPEMIVLLQQLRNRSQSSNMLFKTQLIILKRYTQSPKIISNKPQNVYLRKSEK